MRDKLKSKEYFMSFRELKTRLIVVNLNQLTDSNKQPVMLSWFKKSIFDSYYEILISGYSFGNSKEELAEDYFKCLNYLEEGWISETLLLTYRNKYINQYTLTTYTQILHLAAIGYLLNIDNIDFMKIVSLIDRDQIKDNLLEFIIRAKIKDRSFDFKESYKSEFLLYTKLRLAITEPNKEIIKNLIKDFLNKDWYTNQKSAGWYDSHKSKHDTYCGYWSFETAAIVKIMGIDDSDFRDCIYYPKDLL
jgi:hypothetical protein